jgi:hypothetical protein
VTWFNVFARLPTIIHRDNLDFAGEEVVGHAQPCSICGVGLVVNKAAVDDSSESGFVVLGILLRVAPTIGGVALDPANILRN